MRSTISAAAIAGLSLAFVGTAAAQQAAASGSTRIAYVNPQALFINAPGRAQAESAFVKETEGFRAELNRMNTALNQLMTDYRKAEPTLSAADKERRQRAIQIKEDSLRVRQQELEQRASQRQSELMAPIMESVRKVLEDIRVEDGFAMILSSEPGASPIMVADKNLDITERVVARLRTIAATKPASAAAPAQQKPSGAPVSAPSGVTRPRPPGGGGGA